MDIANELPSTDFDRLVGIEAHVEKMKTMVCLESDEVKMVGIWGPAGIGKTTIAKALYNQISSKFQLKYFKDNIGGKSAIIRPENLILNELVYGILDHRDLKISNIYEVPYRLMYQRVLLILDDFRPQELQALQVQIRQLSFGSKVIVTSENISTLRGCGIDQIHTYKVDYPSSEEAVQIFSYSAFGQSSPPRGYLEHAIEIAELVAPIPLGLKVLGASLRGKSKDEWTTTTPRLRTRLLHKDIEKVLAYFYDCLSDKDKGILLRLAISARRGENVKKVIFSLAENDWDVEKVIQTLADLALISRFGDGGIMVHHLVQSIMYTEILMWENVTPALY